jgi:hypothetical protein
MEQPATAYFEHRLGELRRGRAVGGRPTRRAAQLRFLINEAVDHASETVRAHGKELRPDGAVALHLGFSELVARPLAATQDITPDQLREVVFTDVERVAQQAAVESDAPDVSSHAIVAAVDHAWPELEIAKMPYW